MAVIRSTAVPQRARLGLLALSFLTMVGCWEKAAGPAIRSEFSTTVHMDITFVDGAKVSFTLKPGAAFVQHPPGMQITTIIVSSLGGAALLKIDEVALHKANPASIGNILFTVTPLGLKTMTEGRQRSMEN